MLQPGRKKPPPLFYTKVDRKHIFLEIASNVLSFGIGNDIFNQNVIFPYQNELLEMEKTL